MQIVAALLFAAAVLFSAGIVYHVLAWSLDSPVLRHALRGRRARQHTLLALALMAGATPVILGLLGARQVSGPAVFFGGMIFLFGSATLLFLELVIDDLSEVFRSIAGRFALGKKFDGPPVEVPPLQFAPGRRCASQSNCSAAPRPCESGVLSNAWRPTDWQRSHLRR